VSTVPSGTSRCCGALPGLPMVNDALEMQCPSELSPPQPPSPHHCGKHALSLLAPAPPLNLRTAGAFRKRPRASASRRLSFEKSVAHLSSAEKRHARCSLELLLKSSQMNHQADSLPIFSSQDKPNLQNTVFETAFMTLYLYISRSKSEALLGEACW